MYRFSLRSRCVEIYTFLLMSKVYRRSGVPKRPKSGSLIKGPRSIREGSEAVGKSIFWGGIPRTLVRVGGECSSPDGQDYPEADAAVRVPIIPGRASVERGRSRAGLQPYRGAKIYLGFLRTKMPKILPAALKRSGSRN